MFSEKHSISGEKCSDFVLLKYYATEKFRKLSNFIVAPHDQSRSQWPRCLRSKIWAAVLLE